MIKLAAHGIEAYLYIAKACSVCQLSKGHAIKLLDAEK